jgi:hypothetical protein
MLVNVSNPSLGLKRLCVTRHLLTTLSISRPLVTQLDARQLVCIKIASLQLGATITLKSNMPNSLY